MEPLHESEKEAGKEPADENASLSNAALFRKLASLKLKLVASYVLDGFAPVVAVIAVIVAVIAINGNKSGEAQIMQNAATIAGLKTTLLESRGELEKIKAAMAQEKSRHEEERKKHNEQIAQIIQGVSKLQQKMKIHPTMEEQMQQPVATLIATPPVATAAPAIAPAPASAKAVVPSAAPAKAAVPVTAATVSTGNDKKPGSQTQILKEAIDKFNRK